MTLLRTILLASILINLFACKNKAKQGSTSSTGETEIDNAHHKVRQQIDGELVMFDYSDFHDLKNNKHYDRFLAGQLKLPSGKVVCTDPMYREIAFAQNWSVSPGNYAVYLYIGLDGDFEGRVAYAELVFKEEIPVSWEMSLIPQDLLDSFGRKLNGMYPVENGLSSFSDLETFQAFEKEIDQFYAASPSGNYYSELLEPLFARNASTPKSSRGHDWVNYTPKNAAGNIFMFGAGLGDGFYPRYVGYDKDKHPVRLVTDFVSMRKASEDD